jgi:hypothetical protein
MPLPKTYEEILAQKLNPRNYSNILPLIYQLRRRQEDEYVPSAFDRIVYASLAVGENSASAIFDSISGSPFSKGAEITLSGTATYKLMSGATLLELKPAIKITAQIDIGRSGPPESIPAFQVECKGNEIITTAGATLGNFSFKIPAEITQKLSIGKHYVYIDAHSPNNPPIRLTAAGTTNNQRDFTIQA